MADFFTLAGAGSILGAGLSYLGGQQTNAANARQAALQMQFQQAQAEQARQFDGDQAQINRLFAIEQLQRQQYFAKEGMAWEERMANTAYQRATQDMRAAGINPMLAISQGGASTPGAVSGGAGSVPGTPHSPSMSGASARMENALGNAASTGVRVAEALGSLQALFASVGKTEAETGVARALEQTELARKNEVEANTALSIQRAVTEGMRPEQIRAEIARLRASETADYATAGLRSAETGTEVGHRRALLDAETRAAGARAAQHETETDITRRFGRGHLGGEASSALGIVRELFRDMGRVNTDRPAPSGEPGALQRFFQGLGSGSVYRRSP